MNERSTAMDDTAADNSPTATGSSGLSTADMAAAADQTRGPVATGPKYVEGEEASMARNATDAETPLFPADQSAGFRDRWTEVQAGFVDEPRNAVQQADGLVADVMQQLARIFADERAKLEAEWDRGDDVSTEDLRLALRRYRSFFERLLSA
ncbi:MAG: hypothetical protein U0531_02905 [Dehalococcoidia bacterium]